MILSDSHQRTKSFWGKKRSIPQFIQVGIGTLTNLIPACWLTNKIFISLISWCILYYCPCAHILYRGTSETLLHLLHNKRIHFPLLASELVCGFADHKDIRGTLLELLTWRELHCQCMCECAWHRQGCCLLYVRLPGLYKSLFTEGFAFGSKFKTCAWFHNYLWGKFSESNITLSLFRLLSVWGYIIIKLWPNEHIRTDLMFQ